MTSKHDTEDKRAMLSIGAVAKATGIRVETLRTWERRYGFPRPERTGSGHRKYPRDVIAHLELINTALEQGHRPSNVVGESEDYLRDLLGIATITPTTIPPAQQEQAPSPATARAILDTWMNATLELDADALRESFDSIWFRLGAHAFLAHLVAPFLVEIGEAWFAGRIAVLHEQFASAQLKAFLSSHWRPLSERAGGPLIVCAALPGEYHIIGLHMVAVLVAMAGCQLIFMGCDTPLEAIVDAASDHGAVAVLVSVSAAANNAHTTAHLTELRALLDRDIELIVGGAGAPAQIPSTIHIDDLEQLRSWAEKLCISSTRSGALAKT